METEVRVYERGSWDCLATLQDHAHKEVFATAHILSSLSVLQLLMLSAAMQAVNVVSWSGCGQFLSCGGVDGVASVWDFSTKSVTGRSERD